MSVKRYAAHTNIDDFKSDWHESKDGPMVRHEDYAALEAICAALAAEVYDLKHPGTYLPSKRETPALDAFLAEVRAQGVEAFDSVLEARGRHHDYVEIANTYAAQLRKGVQS